jgi:tryptophan-rich sensory protein
VTPRPSFLGLLWWLALCFAAAWFGARFVPGAWYEALAKPWWTPPNWVFAPVWTILYALMGLAAWLVWRDYRFRGAPWTLGLFVAQLALNAAWSWIFFELQRPGWALVDLATLWVALLATLVAFWRLKPVAGALLAPYFLWVSFAGGLNFAWWRLNL